MIVRIYPIGEQWGLLVNETTEYIFDTLAEVYTMTDKLDKAQAIISKITSLAGIDDLLDVVNAHEYGQAQASAFTDQDVESLNVTAADLFNSLNLLTQNKTLLTNGAPAQADYMPIVNKVRDDI